MGAVEIECGLVKSVVVSWAPLNLDESRKSECQGKKCVFSPKSPRENGIFAIFHLDFDEIWGLHYMVTHFTDVHSSV